MFNDYPDVMTVSEAAKALNVGKSSIYKLVNSQALGSRRIGKKILIPKICLNDFIQSARYKVTNCSGGLSDTF